MQPSLARRWAVLLILLTAACTGPTSQETPPQTASPDGTARARVADYPSLVEALESKGFHVRDGRRTGENQLFRPGRILFIDGVHVSTFEYPSERAAKQFRSGVSERGDEIPTVKYGMAIVQFGGRPHWFDEGRLVVLYLDDDQSTLRALRLVLGPQFAGL